MATWAEFAADEPDLAAAGRQLLYQYGPGLGFLATVRADGGPRLHPFCPVVAEGELWAFILRESPKCGDLFRDGRYAMHALTPEQVDDEFYVTGRANEREGDAALRESVRAATVASIGTETEVLFSLDIEHVLLSTYTHRGQWPPTYTHWHSAERPGG